MSSTRFAMEALAYAWGEPACQGLIRQQAEDFQVDEVLGYDLGGEGEHVCLHIQKRHRNTAEVAQAIARLAGVKSRDVSYAGLKDRQAVTRQWFSVYLANKAEPDWRALTSDDIEILAITRHQRKLRRGALKGNRFRLRIRDLQGACEVLEERLARIEAEGVPNYFGEQRFGHANLERASAMFEGCIKVRDRGKRGIYLSAARSAIFNTVLSARVADGTWNRAQAGDMMMLAGTHSVFLAETLDDAITERIRRHDIFPTGPLWGQGQPATRLEVAQLETRVGGQFELYCQGLAKAGMKQERRSLVLLPEALRWSREGSSLLLEFFLPAGSYATSVLRELLQPRETHRRKEK